MALDNELRAWEVEGTKPGANKADGGKASDEDDVLELYRDDKR